MEKKIYDVVLEDWQEGVFATSLVKNAAIGSDFVFFSEEQDIMMFANEEKREIVGAIMIPDVLIPRKAEDGSIYYVRFSKETIASLNERMKEIGYDKNFTFAHKYSAGNNVKLIESWIKEFEEDKSVAYGFDLPVGTMFMKVKVVEDTLWELVKTKKLKGFSIELNASYKLNEELTKQEKMSKLELFESNHEHGGGHVVWDGGGISSDTILFYVTTDENGNEKVSKFNGQFTIGETEYSQVDGVLEIVEKAKAPETKYVDSESFSSFAAEIMQKLSAITESVNGMKAEFESKTQGIEQGIEEVKLFQAQGGVGESLKTQELPKEKEQVNLGQNAEKLKVLFKN